MFVFFLSFINLCVLLPQQSKEVDLLVTSYDFKLFPPPTEFVYNNASQFKYYYPHKIPENKCYRNNTCPGGIIYPQTMMLPGVDSNNNTVAPPNGTQVVIFASLDFKSWWVGAVSTSYDVMSAPNTNVTIDQVCVAYPQFHYIVACLLRPHIDNSYSRSSTVYKNMNWNMCERIATYCGGVCSYVDTNSTNAKFCNNSVIPEQYLTFTNTSISEAFRIVYRDPVSLLFVFSFANFVVLKHIDFAPLFRIPKPTRRRRMPTSEMEKDYTYSQCTTFATEDSFTVYRSLICSFVSHIKFLRNRDKERKKRYEQKDSQEFSDDSISSFEVKEYISPKMFRFIIYYDRVCENGKDGNETKKNIYFLKTIHTIIVRLREIIKNNNPNDFSILCSLSEKLIKLNKDKPSHYTKIQKSFTPSEAELFKHLTNTVHKDGKKKVVHLEDQVINLLKYPTHVYNIPILDNYVITTLNPDVLFFEDRKKRRGIIERILDLLGTSNPPPAKYFLSEIYYFFFDRKIRSPGKYDGIESARKYLLLEDSNHVNSHHPNQNAGILNSYQVSESSKKLKLKPDPGRNIFMGIIDARHAPRAEYWLVTISQFFNYNPKNNPQIVQRRKKFRSTQQLQQFDILRETDEIGRECGHFFYITNYLRNLVHVVTSSGSQSVTHLGNDSSGKEFSFKFAVTEDLATSIHYILRGEKFGYTAYKDICFSSMKEKSHFFISLMRWSAGSIECFFRTFVSLNIFYLVFIILLINSVPVGVTVFAYYSNLSVYSVVIFNLVLILIFIIFWFLCQTARFQSLFVLYACLTYPFNSLLSSNFWMIFVVTYLSFGFVVFSNPLVITILTIFSLFMTLTMERIIIFLQQQHGHQVAGKGADSVFTAYAFKNWMTSPFLSYFILIAGIVNYFDRPKWNMNIFHNIFKYCIRAQCLIYLLCIFVPFLLRFFEKLSIEPFQTDQILQLLRRTGSVNLAEAGWIGAALATLYLTLCFPKLVNTTKAKVVGGISLTVVILLGTVCMALFLFPGLTSFQLFLFRPTYIYTDTSTAYEEVSPNDLSDYAVFIYNRVQELNLTKPWHIQFT